MVCFSPFLEFGGLVLEELQLEGVFGMYLILVLVSVTVYCIC